MFSQPTQTNTSTQAPAPTPAPTQTNVPNAPTQTWSDWFASFTKPAAPKPVTSAGGKKGGKRKTASKSKGGKSKTSKKSKK